MMFLLGTVCGIAVCLRLDLRHKNNIAETINPSAITSTILVDWPSENRGLEGTCPDAKALENQLAKCYGLVLVPMMLDLQHQLQRDHTDAPESRKPAVCPDVKALRSELRTWQRRADMLDDFNRVCHKSLDDMRARKP
jgi:hypothetical protein